MGGTRISTDQPSITARLARNAAEITYDGLPEDAVFLAKHCLLDWLGVTLAGSGAPLTRILRDEIADEGGHPQATLVGSDLRVSTRQAALVNGAAGHALDYDDVHNAMTGHPTVPVLPAVFALAEQRAAAGRDLLTAFIAGFEVECRLGLLVNPSHYARGFHSTGTLGTFGAAAACSRLLGSDEATTAHALGIAAAQAAGLKSMFGTMCKPFHAGKAAANGLLAANLAARGFVSNPEAIETAQGFAATQTDAANVERCLAGQDDGFAIRSVLFKYHAACYGTHSTLESLLQMKERDSLEAGDVESVLLRVPLSSLAMCNIPEPQTALEGKFSLRFTAALALGHDDTGEAAFTDGRVHEPALVALRDRVTVEGDPSMVDFETAVTVRTKTGSIIERSVDVNAPATDLDRQWERLAAKFRALAGPVIGSARAGTIVEQVRALDELGDVRELARLLRPAPAAAPA